LYLLTRLISISRLNTLNGVPVVCEDVHVKISELKYVQPVAHATGLQS